MKTDVACLRYAAHVAYRLVPADPARLTRAVSYGIRQDATEQATTEQDAIGKK
jgi:hypothetical protein